MSLIRVSTLRGVGPCSTAALFVQPSQKKMDQQKSAMVGCFIVSPTHVSYKTVPNILPWWEKHHLASTSFDQKGLCPEQIQPSTLGDAWGIMEIPAIARLEGLKVKVKNPWTKNDIFNWHLYVHFWWNCAILLSDLLYFHVTSWAQKHAEVPDSLCLRLAVHICTSSSSRPWSHGSIADNLTTGFFGSKYGPNTTRHGETWRQHVSLPLWIRSFGTCIFDGFYDWFGIAHVWLTLIFGLILVELQGATHSNVQQSLPERQEYKSLTKKTVFSPAVS